MRELAVITTYYNPCGYATRRRNYDIFAKGMAKAGVTLVTVDVRLVLSLLSFPRPWM